MNLTNIGRGADNFQKDPILLEVFSKGTVVTTYEEFERRVEERNADNQVIGSHMERSVQKFQTGKCLFCV